VPVDHLELVQNGRVVRAFVLQGDRRTLDAAGDLRLERGGWVVLRAWNDAADPLVLDLYPYATTSPVYLADSAPLRTRQADAAYFVTWMDRVLAEAAARDDYNDAREKEATLDYLRQARDGYRALASGAAADTQDSGK